MRRFLLVFLPLSLSAFPIRFERSAAESDVFTAHGVTFRARGVEFPGAVLTLAGGRMRAPAAGPLTGRISYLLGRDPAGWRRDVAQYDSVIYRQVYPGIDLVFHDAAGRLEYDFAVAPGADPRAIRVRFDGGAPVSLEGGELLAGGLRQHRPAAFQQTSEGRRAVPVRYVLRHGEVSFAVDAYDRTLPLTIDPVLSYATYAGGSGAEVGTSIAVDCGGQRLPRGQHGFDGFPGEGRGRRAPSSASSTRRARTSRRPRCWAAPRSTAWRSTRPATRSSPARSRMRRNFRAPPRALIRRETPASWRASRRTPRASRWRSSPRSRPARRRSRSIRATSST